MKNRWIASLIIILIAVICMFLFKEIKYRFIIICISSILVSLVTRPIKK
ncbi:hypothetical protein SAMN05428976_10499 [Clostridium sp. USBA 49]|nr:hypothetical protein [Clostridium sp. USBA 49]SKA80673.1 hypothetical protein SAMN05428976_10499 [Clostridium sp. USBA 49]